MQLKTKVQLGFLIFILFIIIFDAFYIPLVVLKDEVIKKSLECTYGNFFNATFNIVLEIIILFWIYSGLMVYIELYSRKTIKNGFFNFIRSRPFILTELIFPTLKNDKKYMKYINIARLLSIIVIIGFILFFIIAIPCNII